MFWPPNRRPCSAYACWTERCWLGSVGRTIGAHPGRKKLFKQDKLVSYLAFLLENYNGRKTEADKGSAQSLYQMHRDIAYDFPSTVKQLASTASCSNQGMYEKGRLITVQGHPEFTHDIVEEILESREEMGIFPKGVFADGMKRLKDHDDGVVVAQAFLRFMLEDEP